ncbi:MAG: cyanophycin synthetase [Chloroflexota bacterium]|nr:cyanophycin synthetase [Chloroflexota bacterium]
MDLRRILVLRGPNIWSLDPVLEAWLDLGVGEAQGPRIAVPVEFADRIRSWLPAPEGPGETLAEVLGWVTQRLQAQAWRPVGPSRARATSTPGVYRVAIPYEEESLARECLAVARALCVSALDGGPFDLEAERDRLRALAQHNGLGPSTAALAVAARRRGIPVRRIADNSLLQLGHGIRQRRVWTAETDRTSVIAEAIAKDKELTRMLLKAVGVPVPEGRTVADAEDAWAAAEEVGVPVVVKPQDGNHGRGVATNLTTREQVQAAFAIARTEGDQVLVERHAYGDDYRLLVVGDRLAAAAHREPACVVGDGVSTLCQLVDEVNQDPRRGDEHATALSTIYLDPVALEVLREQGYSLDSVPQAGVRVLIRRNANLSTGGTATDVTDRLHPEIAARAVEATRAIGLDVAGVDLVVRDIGRPLEEQGGVIVEVNAGPGLRMHLAPSAGTPRPVGEIIIDMMFPGDQDGRIPLVGITGSAGTTATGRLVAQVLRRTGRRLGMTSNDGIFLGERRIKAGDGRDPLGARAVLLDPSIEVAVLEASRTSILNEGLGFDRCDVAIVTDIGGDDGFRLGDVASTDERAEVERTLVAAVAPTGTAVLNAADPLAASLVPHCPGSVLYFACDEHRDELVSRIAGGGRGVFVRDAAIILAEGSSEVHLVRLDEVTSTCGARAGLQVESTLAAAAAAWALRVPIETIRATLRSPAGDTPQPPDPLGFRQAGGVGLPLDAGHVTLSPLLPLLRSTVARATGV